MSPKVIIRQNGILVDGNNNPIGDRIKDLKRAIREAEKDKDSKMEDELTDELEELQDESKILIDLRGKLFVFLERPREDTWEIFKTTLSHDTWEIEHPYVYDVPGMGFKVKKVVLRGWPACIYCSAKDETKSPLWPEIQSRFLVTTTNSIPEKYRDGNMLIAQQMSLPKSIQNELIRSRRDLELAEKAATYLSDQIRRYSPQDPDADTQGVFIPYDGILGAILKGEKGVDNRINKRVFSFLRMIALARAHLRYKLYYGHEKLVIADLNEDLHEVLHITQGLVGIPPDKLKEYKNVLLPAYDEKRGPDRNKDGSKVEDIKAVTTKDCCKKHKEVTGMEINTKRYKPRFIDVWLESGLIEEQRSNIDNKQFIYYPLVDVLDEDITKQEEQRLEEAKIDHSSFMISLISRLGRRDNILQHSRIMAPKNLNKIPEKWLELLF
jgi:hypothetical protein